MKRLLLVAVMVLVSLVGMVGFSRDGNEVIALQSNTNPTTGAVNELLDTVYDWETVYDWKKVYAMLEIGYDLDTVYDWETVYARVPASAKMYYLTANGFIGGDAITACDSGFHMASISEIQDSSNLQYVTKSAPSYNLLSLSQGLGPPVNHMGWVLGDAIELTEKDDNCHVFHTDLDSLRTTTTMSLYSFWYDARPGLSASNPTMGWHMASTACSLPKSVWCVKDPE